MAKPFDAATLASMRSTRLHRRIKYHIKYHIKWSEGTSPSAVTCQVESATGLALVSTRACECVIKWTFYKQRERKIARHDASAD